MGTKMQADIEYTLPTCQIEPVSCRSNGMGEGPCRGGWYNGLITVKSSAWDGWMGAGKSDVDS